jgi:hypothetical protein
MIPHRQNAAISHQGFRALLLGVSAGYCQTALVDESGNGQNSDGETQQIRK